MDPVTICVAVVGLVLTVIQNWNKWFGKKRDQWDVMSDGQKEELVGKAMREAYTQTELYSRQIENYPQRVCDYFWTFIKQYEVQDDFETWLNKNEWVKNRIKKADDQYGRGFRQKPVEWKTPAIVQETGVFTKVYDAVGASIGNAFSNASSSNTGGVNPLAKKSIMGPLLVVLTLGIGVYLMSSKNGKKIQFFR